MVQFTHIHCSSRYDRSADELETDLDSWMEDCSLITLTEVAGERRASQLREKGWHYFNARKSAGQDDCALTWESATWHRRDAAIRRLNNRTFYQLNGKPAAHIYSATVVLRRAESGHKLLVSVSHMPAHVEGRDQWRTTEEKWRARKQAYLSSLTNWSRHVADLQRKHQTDASLVVADWNLNLKEDWVRDVLKDHWGKDWHLAWSHFPTEGGSLVGGPEAPDGAPGRSDGDRIIDGSLCQGLEVSDHPTLLHRVRSSDHRPYREGFTFSDQADHPGTEGDTRHGDAWWGFGDYRDDEIYEVVRATE